MSFPNQLIGNIRLNHASRAPLVSTTAQQSERGNDMDRRQCLGAMLLAAAATISPAASAQHSYPSRLVKVVVGFPAGSATDVAARVVAEALARRLGQPFIVDNRPGAASNIAAQAVATSPPDGHTLFVGTVANAINAAFPNAAGPDPAKDFVAVTMIGSVPNVLVVNPSLGVSSVDQLIQAAKAKPGQITFASSGYGTSPHLSGELFSSIAGIKMLHVPYRGSTLAVTGLLGGQVQVMFSPASTVLPHIRAGTLKALAVTGAKRTALAPDLPTVQELGFKDFESSVWFGFLLPAGTRPDVVAKVQAATHAALDQPDVQDLFRAQGIEIVKSSSDEFAGYIRSETSKWGNIIRTAGITRE
jgi:tripartite-type tricarboxylate transporter receptor subunit TctC